MRSAGRNRSLWSRLGYREQPLTEPRPKGAVVRASVLVLVVALSAAAAPRLFFQAEGDDARGWREILSAAGLQPEGSPGSASVIVLRGTSGPAAPWLERMDAGALLILEGESETAAALGFKPGGRRVRVQNVVDARQPGLRVIWEQAVEVAVFETPPEARVFTRERWTGAPLASGLRRGAGAALWVAAPPGERGYERFPFLVHALADLGLEPPFHSRRLWAFFDSSYRLRADVEYLARRWRRSGIAALHVAAWHYYNADPQRGQYLARLIEACHRNAIRVYAWLELPHVSERFWEEHPEWREKTAVLQDAHLDWRKLMNLADRDCFRAVSEGVRRMIERFDWDGVNLAELYFESLEGAANPSRFTPMNETIRAEFRRAQGWDPLDLFKPAAARPDGLRAFLDYRAELAARLQGEWLGELETVRRRKPHLDIVLTHVDDRFDPRMRDAIGADTARVLPMLDRHDFTFLVEDPATVWHLGPQRYSEIAKRYREATPHVQKLAIDLNIVERYQDVYPTKQQTGTELLQLVRLASAEFPTVALYFENSIAVCDLPLLPAAATAVKRAARIGDRMAIETPFGGGVAWNGSALVDGRPWPATDGALVWLPAGSHTVEPGGAPPPVRILDLNGELRSAASIESGVEFAYRSPSRAYVVFDKRPSGLEIDGGPSAPATVETGTGSYVVALPRGQHLVRVNLP